MPDYLLWTESAGEDNSEVFEGSSPEEAMRNYAGEVCTFDSTVRIYAREAIESGEAPYGGGKIYVPKPDGAFWSAEVVIEQKLTYAVGRLTDER